VSGKVGARVRGRGERGEGGGWRPAGLRSVSWDLRAELLETYAARANSIASRDRRPGLAERARVRAGAGVREWARE
jgi:hypothetical protein